MNLEKTDYNGLYRDKETGSVINTNIEELSAYKKQKAHFRKVSNMQTKIDSLEKELSEIKQLLTNHGLL